MSLLRSSLSALLMGSLAMSGLAACTDDTPETSTSDEEIIGGFAASHARYDAVGALGVPNGGSWFPFCTASLITPTAVITAEHCIDGGVVGTSFLIGFDGTHPKRAVPVLGGQGETTVAGGFVGLGSDVAIVHLAEPVTDIEPLALGDLDASMVGTRLIAMGYGVRDNYGTAGQRYMGSETFNGVGGNFLAYLFGSLDGFRPHYDGLAGWVKQDYPTPEAVYAASELLPEYEAHFGGRAGDAQDCYGDSGGPILRSVGGVLTAYGVTSGGWSSQNLVCDLGGVFATFGPATRTFIQRELACPMIPLDGTCEGDVVVRCATPEEGGYRPLSTDCSVLGLTCGLDEAGELGCVEPAPPPEPVELSCVGNCGSGVFDPVSGASCFCDDVCEQYGDCCADKLEVCPAAPAPEPDPEPVPPSP